MGGYDLSAIHKYLTLQENTASRCTNALWRLSMAKKVFLADIICFTELQGKASSKLIHSEQWTIIRSYFDLIIHLTCRKIMFHVDSKLCSEKAFMIYPCHKNSPWFSLTLVEVFLWQELPQKPSSALKELQYEIFINDTHIKRSIFSQTKA